MTAAPIPPARAGEPPRVVMYSGPGCHLCEDALAVLEPVAAEAGTSVAVVDISTDAELRARYGELIPVVVVDGREIAHWRVSAAHARRALARR